MSEQPHICKGASICECGYPHEDYCGGELCDHAYDETPRSKGARGHIFGPLDARRLRDAGGFCWGCGHSLAPGGGKVLARLPDWHMGKCYTHGVYCSRKCRSLTRAA